MRISKIVTHGGLAYLCGQTAKGSAAADAGIAAQTVEVLPRIDTLLAEVGTDASRLLPVTICLREMADFAGMNAVSDLDLADLRPVRLSSFKRLIQHMG